MVPIMEIEMPTSKYAIKCPHKMTATRIIVHNTANDASARNEVAYMQRNNNDAGFHFAVDDKEIIQCSPLNRNTWNAGDGNKGEGNREGIAIEICYSKSGGDKFIKAEKNAAELIAKLLKERNWDITKVTKHKDYSGKNCPHRTMSLGWKRFLNMVEDFFNEKEEKKENKDEKILYRVQTGAYSKKANADRIAKALEAKGYDTYMIVDDGLFKVQVGAYANKANAEAMADKIEAEGFDTYITCKSGKPVTESSASTATSSKTTATTTPAKKTIKVGSKVKVKAGTKDYDKGVELADFVFKNTYKVIQLEGNRAVLDEIMTAVHKDKLTLV